MAASHTVPFGQALLERAFSPDTAATHYAERVVKRPLLIRPTSPTPSARALRRRALNERTTAQQRSRHAQKPRPLSAAQRRRLCMNELPREQRQYALYEPLHRLWTGYMRELLGLAAPSGRPPHVTPARCGQLLASADMHGALVTVVRSRCVDRVGLQGIVVRDTRFTFDLITTDNVLKTVPKEHTVFRFNITLPAIQGDEAPKPLVFDVCGEQFQTRAPDRANKKFRMHYQPDI